MSAKRLVYTTLLYLCEEDGCPYRHESPCMFSYVGVVNRLGEPWEEARLCCCARAQAEADAK